MFFKIGYKDFPLDIFYYVKLVDLNKEWIRGHYISSYEGIESPIYHNGAWQIKTIQYCEKVTDLATLERLEKCFIN